MPNKSIYAQQQLGQKLAWGERPALLIVDFVNGFLDPAMFGGGTIRRAARNTVPLLARARGMGLPVIFTRIVYAKDGSDCGVWVEKAPRLRKLTEDALASQIIPDLAPAPGEHVVCRSQASAFFGSNLASTLVRKGVDTLIIAGCTTSGCVRATVVDAISYNFRPFVVQDCVGDRDPEAHEASLFDMRQKHADLITAREALPELIPA